MSVISFSITPNSINSGDEVTLSSFMSPDDTGTVVYTIPDEAPVNFEINTGGSVQQTKTIVKDYQDNSDTTKVKLVADQSTIVRIVATDGPDDPGLFYDVEIH